MRPAGSLPPRVAVVDPEQVERMRELVAAITGMTEPAVPFATAQGPFAGSLLPALPQPPPGTALVNEVLVVECLRATPIGRQLTVHGGHEPCEDGETLTLEAADGGEVVARLTARVRAAPPSMLGRAGARSKPAHAPVLSVSVSAGQLATYAELSGDHNPVHTDVALARAFGLPERVLHGTLLCCLVEPALRATGIAEVPSRIGMRFLSPACADEPLHIHVNAGARLSVAIAGRSGALHCLAGVSVAR